MRSLDKWSNVTARIATAICQSKSLVSYVIFQREVGTGLKAVHDRFIGQSKPYASSGLPGPHNRSHEIHELLLY